jgi:hypothetical protein
MKKSREFLDYVADIQDAAQHIAQFIGVRRPLTNLYAWVSILASD